MITSPTPFDASDRGFTLIELLVITVLIGILASLSLTSFQLYRASAAYRVSQITMHDARNAIEAGTSDVSNIPAAVAPTSQRAQGPVANAAANRLLPGFIVPHNTSFSVSFDPTCVTAACQYESLQVRHCQAQQYSRWIRYGDGVDVLLENISGSGCP